MPSPTQPAPSISVVIPVKDDARRLERCLAALTGQLGGGDEIVVVDNDSSDDGAEVARRAGCRVVLEREPGIPAAAAAGYDAAGCAVIARLDADSVPPDDWMGRIRDAFAADPDLDAISGPGVFASLPRALRAVADRLYMRMYRAVFERLLGHPPLFGSNFAMRADAWRAARDAVHRHDAAVHDDLDLSFQLPRAARVRWDPELRVPISARPFADPIAFARRIGRGIATVVVNRPA